MLVEKPKIYPIEEFIINFENVRNRENIFISGDDQVFEQLKKNGFPAVTTAFTDLNGDKEWKEKFNNYFIGKGVFIVPGDEPNYAKTVANNLYGLAKGIKILDVDDAEDKEVIKALSISTLNWKPAGEDKTAIPEASEDKKEPPASADVEDSASPQLKDGYTRLANEILDAFAMTKLSGYGFRIIAAVVRKTYGYRKKTDWISNSQFVKMTGILKPHVSRTVKELCTRNILIRDGYKVGLQKDYKQWLLPKSVTLKKTKLPKKVTVTENGNSKKGKGVELPKMDKKLPSAGHTKETIQKKKDCVSPKGSPPSSPDSKRKLVNPGVKQIVDHFYNLCQERKGFAPRITVKDGKLVKNVLAEMSLNEVRACIDFFLKHPKSEEHTTLAAAVSADTINLYLKSKARKESEGIFL